jgi:hypothetical protein
MQQVFLATWHQVYKKFEKATPTAAMVAVCITAKNSSHIKIR